MKLIACLYLACAPAVATYYPKKSEYFDVYVIRPDKNPRGRYSEEEVATFTTEEEPKIKFEVEEPVPEPVTEPVSEPVAEPKETSSYPGRFDFGVTAPDYVEPQRKQPEPVLSTSTTVFLLIVFIILVALYKYRVKVRRLKEPPLDYPAHSHLIYASRSLYPTINV